MSESMKDFFAEEAQEIFESVESILMSVEENGFFSTDNINALFRDMHTLKGSSNAVGFEYFSQYVHYLETFMEDIRSSRQAVNVSVIEFLIDASDEMQVIFYDELNDKLDVEKFKADLKNLIANIEKLDKQDMIMEEVVEEDTSDTTSKKNSKKIQDDEPHLNKTYLGEFVDLVNNINDSLEYGSKLNSYDDEFLRELFRYVHTLKSTALFMNLEYSSNYLHSIETLLDMAWYM